MRGTHHIPYRRSHLPGIIPAHAGNTCRGYRRYRTWWDHPRACGEHSRKRIFTGVAPGSSPRMRGTPYTCASAPGNGGSSPRMRGTLAGDSHWIYAMGIIPAHAGNTPKKFIPWAMSGDHPRACGEHSMVRMAALYWSGSSPRMRGTLRRWLERLRCPRIIPAHAGNTRLVLRHHGKPEDHPRACGEHYRSIPGKCSTPGIIPAHAGNTSTIGCPSSSTRDHPRACGEHYLVMFVVFAMMGSSPRMRGTRDRFRRNGRSRRIIPAHAGNTIVPAAKTWSCRDHPRACGEHRGIPAWRVLWPGSSPRMRGTRGMSSCGSYLAGIIPAHAGNTDCRAPRGACFRDHPRACGEHEAYWFAAHP